MTPLEQQVREALTDEVLNDLSDLFDDGEWVMAENRILDALRPILAQHAHHAQQVRSKWHLEERAGCQVIAANDGSWCCPATDRELELIAQVQALTEERDRARNMVRLHRVECDDPDCVKEIATWPK